MRRKTFYQLFLPVATCFVLITVLVSSKKWILDEMPSLRTTITTMWKADAQPNISASSLPGARFSSSNRASEFIIDTSGLDRRKGYELINGMVQSGRIDFSNVASYHLVDDLLTPMDKEILADPPVRDLETVAQEMHSTIQLVPGTAHSADRKGVRVGDNVTVRVDLKDIRGRQVRKGGHRVRVWMVQKGQRRSMAADVRDLRNGSFLATFPVVWSGRTEVRAAVPRPREFRRIVLTLMAKMKLMNQNVAAYSRDATTEQVVLCSFIPVIAGFPEVCNLTDLNGGLPWYCGKPSKKGLRCDHWAWSGHTSFPLRYPMTDTENKLMTKFTQYPKVLHILPHPLFFDAVEEEAGVQKARANRTCVPLTPLASWTDQAPTGFWEKGTWRPLNHCPIPPLNQACFKDTSLHFLGDSNAIQIYQLLQPWLGCKEHPDPRRSYHPNMLHVPVRCSSARWNAHMHWIPHAYPFFSGSGRWSDTRVKRSAADTLREVPSAGKHAVLLHYFVHFSQAHSHVFALHVRQAARAVSALLARNPAVKVFVRGPHSVTGNEFQLTGNYQVERSFALLRREFRDLRERVVLLNDWDMTVANENYNIHPHPTVQQTLASIVSAHMCS